MNYYVPKKQKLLRDFDKSTGLARGYIVSRYGEELASTLIKDARQEYEDLIPYIPYVNGPPALNSFLRMSALGLSVYRTMKKHGKTASETCEICHEILKARTEAMPNILKKLARWYLFTNFAKNRAKKFSGKDFGGFSFEYAEEGSSWGVNYTSCAIYEFLKEQDAEEFAPYTCLSDVALSDVLGWGLKRTETIADGCNRCDFRFRKGAKTEISSKIPEIQATIEKISGR